MSASILVAYASRYGSTEEVAAAIAGTLRERGPAVDLKPMHDVQTLAGYTAVVLGAPLYIGHWHKDAHHFLAQHSAALTELPVAVFALGPLHPDEEEVQGARDELDQELAKYAWLKPLAVAVFVGKYDPAKLHFFDSLLTRLPASPIYHLPPSDLRDWNAIGSWAADLKLPVVA